MSELLKIYVELLDEGTLTYYHAFAKPLADDLYEVVGHDGYDPEDQYWEFIPGSIVRLKAVSIQGREGKERVLAATHPDPRAIRVSVRTHPVGCSAHNKQTFAICVGKRCYELQATPHYTQEENWDFPPNSLVKVRKRKSHGHRWMEVYRYAN